MTIGYDNVTQAILTDATEVQLNGGVALTAPDVASTLVEVIPYYAPSGTVTFDEGIMPFVRMQSDDVAITPKSFSLPVTHGGVATPAASNMGTPSLKAMPMNINLSALRSARINYFATDQTANTVDPRVGVTVCYDSDPPQFPEIFWQKPANEFAGGTTSGSRTTSPAAMTITGGREISHLVCQVVQQVAAADESVGGFLEFSSSDFLTSMPYRVAVQPGFTPLGEAEALANTDYGPGIQIYTMPFGKGIPIAGRTVIDLAYTTSTPNNTGANVVGGVAYIK